MKLLPLFAATAWSLATLAVWVATERHAYTKFEVVEKVPVQVDPEDPLAEAGFFEGGAETTVRRSEFHLGLLPTPAGLLDKHLLSVTTLLLPAWTLAILWTWRARRISRRPQTL